MYTWSLIYELERKVDYKAERRRINEKSTKGQRGLLFCHESAPRICVAATSTNGWLIGGTQINTLRHCRESQLPPGTRSMRIYCLWTCIATSTAPRFHTAV